MHRHKPAALRQQPGSLISSQSLNASDTCSGQVPDGDSSCTIGKQRTCFDNALMPFSQWQAQQLVNRDLMSAAALLLVYLIYSGKTVPDICGAAASPTQQTLAGACSSQQQHGWPVMYRYLCSQPEDLASAAPKQLQVAAVVATKLILATARAVVTFLGAVVISRDPLHSVVPALRLAALLLPLVPVPYLNLAAVWQTLELSTRRLQRRSSAGTTRSATSSSSSVIGWYHPSTYWQVPQLRHAVIAAQRLLPAVVAAVCKSSPLSDISWFSVFMGLPTAWGVVGKCACQGLIASTLVLPVRLHVLVNILEWLLNVQLYAHSGLSDSVGISVCGRMFSLPHMVISFVCVIVAPSLSVLWLEQGHYRRYQQLQQQHNMLDAAAAPGAAKEGGWQGGNSSSSSIVDRAGSFYSSLKQQHQRTISGSSESSYQSDPDGVTAPDTTISSIPPDTPRRSTSTPVPWMQAGTDSCSSSAIRSISSPLATIPSAHDTLCEQLLADITGSLELAAAAAAAAAHSQPKVLSEDLLQAATLAAGLGGHCSNNNSRCMQPDLSGLKPAISSLLADEAAEVFAAAASAAAAGAVPYYTGVVASLPVSLKVQTSAHHPLSVSSVGPVLTSALHYQLSPFNTAAAPLAITTACFQGCVQLIANVMGLKRQLHCHEQAAEAASLRPLLHNGHGRQAFADITATSSSSKSACSASIDVLAASLLQSVADTLQHHDGNSVCGATSSADALQIDVAVDRAAASSHYSSSSSSSSSTCPSVTLQSCYPACMIADQDQEIRLSLRLSEQQQQQQQQQQHGYQHLQESQSTPDVDCAGRVLVMSGAGVILDEDVVLSDTIRVKLPAQTSGVLHLALLRRSPSQPPPVAAAADRAVSVVSDASAQPHAPLLLLPILVLPEAAAAEMQSYWDQVAAAAAPGDAGHHNSSSNSSRRLEAAASWCYSVLPLSTDIAYVLGVCAAAKTAAAGTGSKQQTKLPLPYGVKLVMSHLLVHLAMCGMWHVMQYVVETAADVFANQGTDNAAAAVEAVASAADRSQSDTASNSDHKWSRSVTKSTGESANLTVCEAGSCKAIDTKAASLVSSSNGKLDSGCAASGGASSGDIGSNRTYGPVTAAELLWGFADAELESAYQAAAFSNSAAIDGIACLFYAVFATGAYRAKGAAAVLGQQGSGRLLLFNEVLCFVLNVWGPVAVLILRWFRVSQRLKQQQSQQQQQQQVIGERCIPGNSSSLAASRCQPRQQSERQKAVHTTAELACAALLKQRLLAVNMSIIFMWGGLLLCGSGSGVLITPVVLTKTWSRRGWSQDLGAIVSLAIRGFTTQVPFSWFLPLAIVQTLLNVGGSIKYGLRPRYWLVVRYVPLLLVTLGVNALQHVQGRRRFCTRHKVAVC